jgi:hypothetical protein
MRRSVATALAGVATAGTITLFLPVSATAATGTLIVNGQPHASPSGCYNTTAMPLRVMNKTNKTATIFQSPNCQGVQDSTVDPNQSKVANMGQSVYIK